MPPIKNSLTSRLDTYAGKRKVSKYFPKYWIQMYKCQLLFANPIKQAANLKNAVVILCISAGIYLCTSTTLRWWEGIENVETLSTFRHKEVHENFR